MLQDAVAPPSTSGQEAPASRPCEESDPRISAWVQPIRLGKALGFSSTPYVHQKMESAAKPHRTPSHTRGHHTSSQQSHQRSSSLLGLLPRRTPASAKDQTENREYRAAHSAKPWARQTTEPTRTYAMQRRSSLATGCIVFSLEGDIIGFPVADSCVLLFFIIHLLCRRCLWYRNHDCDAVVTSLINSGRLAHERAARHFAHQSHLLIRFVWPRCLLCLPSEGYVKPKVIKQTLGMYRMVPATLACEDV